MVADAIANDDRVEFSSVRMESTRRQVTFTARKSALSVAPLLASYITDEKIHGNLPFPRYALHNMIMGSYT
jgi:hypothetical protein